MLDISIDSEEVLNLEEQSYQKGFEEGIAKGAQERYIEGKEYGLQTGFQRFLIVGYLKGLAEYWEDNISSYDQKSLPSHISQLKELLNGVPTSNEEEDVADYDNKVKKARNKARLIANMVGDSQRVNNIDSLVREVGGTLQVSENVEELW
ncbi:uncharacterized protein PRCAT00006247001 [Priceomyces carsonii]|uniref:uncharacterized protein n=1 Tax=Priceomyces carsonii TaxID=28549 RepID=UPI002ED771BD|nr:unnamed protein product [Priceomyces carsonii]